MLKLIIADLDDTLINYTYAHTRAFNKLVDTLSELHHITREIIITTYNDNIIYKLIV